MSHDAKSQPFFSRWSSRKLKAETIAEKPAEQDIIYEKDTVAETSAQPQSHERPIWQRDDVDNQTRQQAMRDLFRKPEFNQTDGLEEYENDYNYHAFSKLGDVVTHEMRRMLAQQIEKDSAVTEASSLAVTDSANPTESESDKEGKPFA